MFKLAGRGEKTNLELRIEEALSRMSELDPESKEYSAITENLERMYKAKSYEKDSRVSPDTIAVIAGNLLGIGLIMNFEKLNVISTKALGFVIRGRV